LTTTHPWAGCMPIGTATAEPLAAAQAPHGRPRVAQGQATETGSTA